MGDTGSRDGARAHVVHRRAGASSRVARSETGRRGLPAAQVRVHVASINTRSATELCIRSMRRNAGFGFELVVGDGGSTDGTVEMLRDFEERGWLDLELSTSEVPLMHGDWLDLWRKNCPRRYCVFSDSDVEYLAPGWLKDMMDVITATKSALVCAHFTPADPTFVHPVYDEALHLAPRPSPWLMMLDLEQVRDIETSFLFHEDPATADEPPIAYDVAGHFFRELVGRGLTWTEMPAEFRAKVHHFGGMSWGLPGGGGNRNFVSDAAPMQWLQTERVRLRELKKRTVVRLRLERLRRTARA